MARISSSRTIQASWESTVTFAPPYDEIRTISPTLTSNGRIFPFFPLLPVPTATTSPRKLPVSSCANKIRPDAVVFSVSDSIITMRSWSGEKCLAQLINLVGEGTAYKAGFLAFLAPAVFLAGDFFFTGFFGVLRVATALHL